MEQNSNQPPEFNSAEFNGVLHTSSFYLNKKRKLQAEQLGLPLPKHKSWDRCFTSEYDFPSNAKPDAMDFGTSIIKVKIDEGARDGSEPESAKDSNSFTGDTDSVMSVSGEAKTELEYPKACPHDQPSSSSVNWDDNCLKTTLYSLESRSLMGAITNRGKSPYIDGEHNSPRHDLGLPTSLNYEEHLLEFLNPIDYNCSEYSHENTEQYINKELDDMLYSNEANPNNYVLSSGRWDVNQEAQPGTKKLTIDKEFEQYFSTLML